MRSYSAQIQFRNRALVVVWMLVTAAVLVSGCRSSGGRDIQPAGDSFFPLAVGNRWVFQADTPGRNGELLERVDTVLVDARRTIHGQHYYHLRAAWPGFAPGDGWVYRDGDGVLIWSHAPGEAGGAFLRFDADVGEKWGLPRGFGCLLSLQLTDDYAIVTTPYGRFDGVRQIGDGEIHCTDFGWGVSVARGLGPVNWTQITIAGLTNWSLVAAHVHDDAADGGASAHLTDGD